jgi:predicted acetyltransferase
MEIRELSAAERASVSLPMQEYAFQATPANADLAQALERRQRFYEGNLTLVAEEDGDAVAQADGLPMRQNVRGAVYPMAGVAGVATLPRARRRGYARALVNELLDRMRDQGHAVSTLYPFRASFYQRFGYVGLPTTRTVKFPPAAFAELRRAGRGDDLPDHRVRRRHGGRRSLHLRRLRARRQVGDA